MQLKTDRLILREFTQQDLRQLALILANPKVMQFSPTGTLSVSQTRAKINSFIVSYKKFGFGKWAVILKESNELIGYCGIALEQIDRVHEPEIGYRLDSKFWCQGLATEAAFITVKYGFEQLKLPYIIGVVELANTASVNVLKKLGMEYIKQTIFYGIEMDVYQLDNNVFYSTFKNQNNTFSKLTWPNF
jgi:RimJ/RimL family protein N-acetyltransferase